MTERNFIILLLLITVAVNFQIYFIPFHGDEITGLVGNKAITQPSFYFERMISLKGFFQRPLSVFSYMANYNIFGPSPVSFHVVNLLVHLVNVFFVFQLAKCLKVNPYLSSAVFALHPLTSACVGQIYGRNYSLGFMFVLIGLVLFLRQKSGHIKLTGFYLLAFLSKQVFLYFPVLFLWLRGVRKSSILLLAAFLSFGLGAYLVHILPNLENASVSFLTYALSQLEHLPLILITSFLVPVRLSLVHRLEFYSGGLAPVLGVALLLLFLWIAVKHRSQALGLVVGCFLITYLPTNSFIPKAEVLLEWRLYPSLAFFFVIVCIDCKTLQKVMHFVLSA